MIFGVRGNSPELWPRACVFDDLSGGVPKRGPQGQSSSGVPAPQIHSRFESTNPRCLLAAGRNPVCDRLLGKSAFELQTISDHTHATICG